MMMRVMFVLVLSLCSTLSAAELTPAERGFQALTKKNFIPAAWREAAYEQVWKHWPNVNEKPSSYDAAFREHYGLPEAPYENGQYPMGLRAGKILFMKGVSIDCMVCHGGSVLGKSYLGLGNSTVDLQALFEDLSLADGRSGKLPFTFSNVRGTTEAGGMAVYLLGYREPDLTVTRNRKDLGLHDDLCEDTPAWWLLKKKKTMYHTGGVDANSVRSKMQFMMTPITMASEFHRAEPHFRDIQQYLKTIQAPKYPLKIDPSLAEQGRLLFAENCTSCHGTYGEKWTYPNKIVPIDEIGTDRKRFDGIEDRFGLYYNQTWFAKENPGWLFDDSPAIATKGYQAPPLDGIWATAPYFHNGSVPTLNDVLNSKNRPGLYTRSFRTDEEAYDSNNVGWIVTKLKSVDPSLSAFERRKIYDTTLPGRSNAGHTYGDHFTEAERKAVIEYLKTL